MGHSTPLESRGLSSLAANLMQFWHPCPALLHQIMVEPTLIPCLPLQPLHPHRLCQGPAVRTASLYEAILWAFLLLPAPWPHPGYPGSSEEQCHARARAHHRGLLQPGKRPLLLQPLRPGEDTRVLIHSCFPRDAQPLPRVTRRAGGAVSGFLVSFISLHWLDFKKEESLQLRMSSMGSHFSPDQRGQAQRTAWMD